MKKYEKPLLEETKIVIEGVFAGSGEFFCKRDNANGKFRPNSHHCSGCDYNKGSYCSGGHLA